MAPRICVVSKRGAFGAGGAFAAASTSAFRTAPPGPEPWRCTLFSEIPIPERRVDPLIRFLKSAGWKKRADRWVGSAGREFHLVEETAPGSWDRSMSAFLAQAILRARASTPRRTESVAALQVKRASPLMDERLARFVAEVAPDQSWILYDPDGRVFPHVQREPELARIAAQVLVRPPPQPPVRRQHSFFTDLNQWMLKVLLAPLLPEKLLAAPRGRPIRNASTLAEAAGVSLPAAARFVRGLEAEGQLDTRFGDLRIARPLELLTAWRDRMGHPARQEAGVSSVRGSLSLDALLSLASAYAEPPAKRGLVLGLHHACAALGYGHVAGTPPVVWTDSLTPERLEAHGLVVAAAGQAVDLVLRVPRYPESLFRGAVKPAGPPATDIIQCWLDVSHYRVRGQEQADFLWRRVLKPAFER